MFSVQLFISVQKCRCTNVHYCTDVHRCTNVQCSYVQWTSVQVYKCSVLFARSRGPFYRCASGSTPICIFIQYGNIYFIS
jgi:hypothetical protein